MIVSKPWSVIDMLRHVILKINKSIRDVLDSLVAGMFECYSSVQDSCYSSEKMETHYW